jgi:hypothetical protein
LWAFGRRPGRGPATTPVLDALQLHSIGITSVTLRISGSCNSVVSIAKMNDELSGTGLLTTEEVCPERMPRLSLPRSFTRLNAKKQSAILKQLTDAATAAIDKGWYVFPAPYLTKTTFKGTRGSKDASQR